MKPYFERFKDKWNITSNVQLAAILVVFAVTGSLAVYVAEPILVSLSIRSDTLSAWIYYPLRILIILPCYQILLIIVGTLFGQFRFFWQLEKKTVGRLFRQRNKADRKH